MCLTIRTSLPIICFLSQHQSELQEIHIAHHYNKLTGTSGPGVGRAVVVAKGGDRYPALGPRPHGAYSCMSYRLGKKALARKPIVWPDVGSKGRTTTLISPKGYVRVNGELWQASSSSTIHVGEEIIVVGIEGMTLLINPAEKR